MQLGNLLATYLPLIVASLNVFVLFPKFKRVADTLRANGNENNSRLLKNITRIVNDHFVVSRRLFLIHKKKYFNRKIFGDNKGRETVTNVLA